MNISKKSPCVICEHNFRSTDTFHLNCLYQEFVKGIGGYRLRSRIREIMEHLRLRILSDGRILGVTLTLMLSSSQGIFNKKIVLKITEIELAQVVVENAKNYAKHGNDGQDFHNCNKETYKT